MKIQIRRIHKEPSYTIGEMLFDGKTACFTLEDAVREVSGEPVTTWKIPGNTAIPDGTYEVHITSSARFGRPMPQVMDVPGFDGIRIHPGNTSADTGGCILVGTTWIGGDQITQSRMAFAAVYSHILAAWSLGERITLEIA